MKKFFLFFIVLMSLNAYVFATTDDGFEVNFVGFMGKQQEYALIRLSSVQGDLSQEVLYAVSMKSEKPQRLDVVKIKPPVRDEEIEKLEKIFESPEKIWQYYLSKIKNNKIYNEKFVKVDEVTLLINGLFLTHGEQIELLNHEGQKIEASLIKNEGEERVDIPISPKEVLTLKSKVLKTYDSFKVTGENCHFDQKKVYCSTCDKIKIQESGVSATINGCQNKNGTLTKSYTDFSGTLHKVGEACQCHEKAFLMALEVSSKKHKVLGPAFLADRFTYDQVGPPQLYQVAFYQNQSGDILITGDLAHTPLMNGDFYGAVTVLPKTLR